MSLMHSLSVFFAVAETGSFSAAAKKLGLTQPTVSFHIENLEKNFNCQLFNRGGRGAQLSAYGHKLLEFSHPAAGIIELTNEKMKSLIAGDTGNIIIGASTIPSEYLLPSFIGRFHKTHPNIHFSISTGSSDDVLQGYSNGKFPLGIIGREPPEGTTGTVFFEDELILVAVAAVSDKYGAAVSLDELYKLPLVLRSYPSGSRCCVEDTLVAHSIRTSELNIIIETDSNTAMHSLIKNGTAAGFASSLAITEDIANGTLIKINIPGIKISRKFYLLKQEEIITACGILFYDFLLSR